MSQSHSPAHDEDPRSAAELGLGAAEVILVSYRSRHHVEELLGGWPADLAVAIVDNSANVDGVRDLAGELPNVRYLDGGGQGFARGANLGALSSTASHLLFVNPDCRPTAEQLAELVRGLAADDGALTHAATPIGHDGVIGIGVGGWEPTVRRAAVHALGLHKLFRTAGLYAHPAVGEHVEVDWVTGTCIVVDSERFRAVGGFDDAFFVYCEDVALGRRARARGWRSKLRDDILVAHGSGSSGAPSTEMRRLQGASFTTYLKRYGSNASSAAIIRALYLAGCAWRVVALAATGRRERAEATLAIIRGVVTQQAFVAGTEVALARAQEAAAG